MSGGACRRGLAAAVAALALLAAPGAADASVGEFAMAVQRDGKILVAGGSGLLGVSSKEVGAVVRYLPDGRLDRSFGGGDGVFLARGQKPFTAMALQRDGRIVLAAPIGELVRLRPDGGYDANFGRAGVKYAGAESSWYPTSVAVAGNGSIYTAGMTGYLEDSGEHWYGRLYRTAPNGDTGGWVGAMTTGDGREGEPKSVVNDIVLGPGGSVIGAGTVAERRPDARGHAALARLIPAVMGAGGTPSGPDPSFGGGLVQSNIFPAGLAPEAANALAWQGNELLIGGEANTDLMVSRYTSKGALDMSFGRRGFWTTGVGKASNDVANALAVDAKGGFVAAGGSTFKCGDFDCSRLLVARYGKDGHPVRGFGHGGAVTPLGTAAEHPVFEIAYGIALRPWGSVLVGGIVGGPSAKRFFLRRYLADGTPDKTFGTRGRVTTLPVAADRAR